jgi:molybdopterin synthase catalytic subunit
VTHPPDFESWLDEIKTGPGGAKIGMYLMHNGVVRGTSRDGALVTSMELTHDHDRLRDIVALVEARPGIVALRVWINEGTLSVGDDIMRVLVAGDFRENVFTALQDLVRLIKTECVRENEVA